MVGRRCIHAVDRHLVLVGFEQQFAERERRVLAPAQGLIDPRQMILDPLQGMGEVAFGFAIDDPEFGAKHICRQVFNVHTLEALSRQRLHLFDE